MMNESDTDNPLADADAASSPPEAPDAPTARADSADEDAAAQATEVPAQSVLESLPVEIEFHLGKLILAPQQLQQLAVGAVLAEMPGLLFPKVEMVSGGRVFAEGELVAVGGRTGFRITRILE